MILQFLAEFNKYRENENKVFDNVEKESEWLIEYDIGFEKFAPGEMIVMKGKFP